MIFYCLLYGGCSFCFSLSVQYLARELQVELLLYENVITAKICMLLGKRNHTSKDTLLYSLFYSLQMVTAMKALQRMNIAIFITFKRTLIVFILFQKKWKLSHIFSALFITSGAAIAGVYSFWQKFNSFEQEYYGYILILLNNIFNALALQKSKQLNRDHNIDPFELLFQNSGNQIPFLFIGAYFEFLNWEFNQEILIPLTLVSLMGFMQCYSTNLCNMHNSPTAIAITHHVKDIIITSYSISYDNDIYILSGIVISYLGSILYAIQKYKESQNMLPIKND